MAKRGCKIPNRYEPCYAERERISADSQHHRRKMDMTELKDFKGSLLSTKILNSVMKVWTIYLQLM